MALLATCDVKQCILHDRSSTVWRKGYNALSSDIMTIMKKTVLHENEDEFHLYIWQVNIPVGMVWTVLLL